MEFFVAIYAGGKREEKDTAPLGKRCLKSESKRRRSRQKQPPRVDQIINRRVLEVYLPAYLQLPQPTRSSFRGPS